jgi:1-acyl-sn-glycerol-3-phosphate acyltransferase
VRQWLGSIAFTLYLFLSVPVYAPLVLLSAPFAHRVSYRLVERWTDSVLFMLRSLCRLDYVVEGTEHLGSENTVVLMKHSSSWETIAQFRLFPKQTWVLKRELLWLPFFGWVLPLLKPIAINRGGGRVAVQQVIDQGLERLRDGFWVVIFPEGTRVPYGRTRRFGLSGALLAVSAGKPVVPVAHDAGYFWPRRGWHKKAGTIRVRIGPPIATAGRDAREVTAEAQQWIEDTLAELAHETPRSDAPLPSRQAQT